MPSTYKTSKLNLNLWISSDKPTRTDFISDNNIIDNILGTHIENQDLHLTADEKLRLDQPFTVEVFQGTDDETRSVELDFTPSLIFYFAIGTPAITFDGDVTVVNTAVSAKDYGTSGGLLITESDIKIKQQTADNLKYNLNNSELQYIMIAFR